MPAAIKVNLRRSFSRYPRVPSLLSVRLAMRKAKSVFLSTLPPRWWWVARGTKTRKERKGVSQERDRNTTSYLFRLFGNNPTERLLLLRTLAVPCRWGMLAFSCASLLLFSRTSFLTASSRRLPADSAPTLHSSTSTGRNRQHRSDERPHGPALKGYRFHVTGVTKRYLRGKSGLRFERTFPINFSLVCLPRHAHREVLLSRSSAGRSISRQTNHDGDVRIETQMLIDHRSVYPWGR